MGKVAMKRTAGLLCQLMLEFLLVVALVVAPGGCG